MELIVEKAKKVGKLTIVLFHGGDDGYEIKRFWSGDYPFVSDPRGEASKWAHNWRRASLREAEEMIGRSRKEIESDGRWKFSQSVFDRAYVQNARTNA